VWSVAGPWQTPSEEKKCLTYNIWFSLRQTLLKIWDRLLGSTYICSLFGDASVRMEYADSLRNKRDCFTRFIHNSQLFTQI
jgi:hypothetical protein